MSSLLMVVAIVAASAQCYIVGSDGQWHPNTAAAELTETATTGECMKVKSPSLMMNSISSSPKNWQLPLTIGQSLTKTA